MMKIYISHSCESVEGEELRVNCYEMFDDFQLMKNTDNEIEKPYRK